MGGGRRPPAVGGIGEDGRAELTVDLYDRIPTIDPEVVVPADIAGTQTLALGIVKTNRWRTARVRRSAIRIATCSTEGQLVLFRLFDLLGLFPE